MRSPVRICDLGGWTDTWFGGPGRVLNIAVEPGVQVTLGPGDGRPGAVRLELASFGESYEIVAGARRVPRHPFVEAAVDTCPPLPGASYTITVASGMPPGAGTGTSAAVVVAVLAALSAANGEEPAADSIARAAHRIESEVLGGQSGIQDQLASARGGIQFLRIDDYPQAVAERLPEWPELEPRLTVVFLGRPHRSTAVHEEVIAAAPTAREQALGRLREAAAAGRRAVLDRDVDAFGRALLANSDGQRRLHPSLIGTDAGRVADLAMAHGAAGWKVNGAGGEGGSITVLHRDRQGQAAFRAEVVAANAGYRIIPVRLCPTGVVVERAP